MNNITYNITDPPSNNIDSPNNVANNSWYDVPLISTQEVNDIDIRPEDIDLNERCARAMDYELNYNIKYLIAILKFYGFKKCKLNKHKIILKIVAFESDSDNLLLFENRKRLFDNFIELKNNPYFKKLILKGFT